MFCIVQSFTYICVIQTDKMNIENTQAQMRKGILEFCILSILNSKEAYPSEVLLECGLKHKLLVNINVQIYFVNLRNYTKWLWLSMNLFPEC